MEILSYRKFLNFAHKVNAYKYFSMLVPFSEVFIVWGGIPAEGFLFCLTAVAVSEFKQHV